MADMNEHTTTIAALATAAAPAGVGVVRVSGPQVPQIAQALIGRSPQPRHAHYVQFRDAAGATIDTGLLLFFPAPHSYTGEHVLELHGHGSPVLLRLLVDRVCALGAQPARAGEFSERAFLNGKLDLAQAEAVADLISSQTEAAARAAVRSLDGEFSRRVQQLLAGLIDLRLYIEAAIDFPEEEIDFLADGRLRERSALLHAELLELLSETRQGQRLRDGFYVVIAGAPNAGKSSLLNALAGSETAIVTAIAGTTRDVLREQLDIDGLAVTLVDTAGLRQTDDPVEGEGIRRAQRELERADLVLLLDDGSGAAIEVPPGLPRLAVRSKVDLLEAGVRSTLAAAQPGLLLLSVREPATLAALKARLRAAAGLSEGATGSFSARARHVAALEEVAVALTQAQAQLLAGQGELAAADLRAAQDALGRITGAFSPDDLLGEIFSRFCIGK